MVLTERVILAGHTGLEKGRAAHALKAFLEAQDNLANRVGVYDFEDVIRQSGGGDPRVFAGIKGGRAQRERWRRAWEHLQQTIQKGGDRCSIVHMHLVFAQGSHRICPAPLSVVAEWSPDLVAVLIDDVYAVKRRIQLKDFAFSFAQLYDWRTVETMFADQLAIMTSLNGPHRQDTTGVRTSCDQAFCDCVVAAVKHPIATLGRLILDRSLPRVYASFPISSTRGVRERRDEIDDFRGKMHQLFVTFDPLTIEELPLLYDRGQRASGRCEFHPTLEASGQDKPLADQRWDARIAHQGDRAPMVWEPDEAANHCGEREAFYPVRFEARELDELWQASAGDETTVTNDHITIRDLRLVDQADFVVCYRPYWDGQLTGGVDAEITHANTAGKPVYAYVANDRKAPKPLLGSLTERFDRLDKFWRFLEGKAREPQPVPRPIYY